MSILTAEQRSAFDRDGFLIVRDPALAEMRRQTMEALKQTALGVLERLPDWQDRLEGLRTKSVSEILEAAVAQEKDNEVSGLMYRMFVSTPELLGLISNPFLLALSKEVGVVRPYASTLPITRIDRPGDEVHKVPPHQDWWYSLVCPNCVTIWFTYGPVEADMGILEVVPGSHTRGYIPFKPHVGGPNPFTAAQDDPDENYIQAIVPDDAVLIFNQKLLHRSGHNASKNRVRCSIQVRFNDMTTADDLDTTFRVVGSAKLEERQQELLRQGGWI